MSSNNPHNKDNPASILRETREHKGISLEMVHEATKIPLDALKAIEQGYSIHRLSPFYYRGFIRIYAKYLELDETRILQSYGISETSAPKVVPVAAPVVKETPKARPRMVASPQQVPTDNFIKDTLRPLLKRNLTGVRLWQIAKIFILLFALFLVFKMIGCVVHKSKSAPKKQTAPVVEKKTPASVKTEVKEKSKAKPKKEDASKNERPSVDKAAIAALESETLKAKEQMAKAQETRASKVEVKTEAVKADNKTKHIELTVRATKNGWLEVKADGQVVFLSTLKKGAAETWSATDTIELSGKNINLLEFELNGKMLGALGPSDRGAKRVVFTKDGLSVKK